VGYLQAFTTLLFNKPSPSRPFKRVYIDGSAGSGSFKFGAITTGFFRRDAMEIAGSAQRALRVNPPFDELHFIEKRPACLNALREMVADDHRVFTEVMRTMQFANYAGKFIGAAPEA
jgi:hypothetical protein